MVATDGKSEGSHNHHPIKSEMTGVVTDGKIEGSHNIYNTCVFIILITNDGKIDWLIWIFSPLIV